MDALLGKSVWTKSGFGKVVGAKISHGKITHLILCYEWLRERQPPVNYMVDYAEVMSDPRNRILEVKHVPEC